MRFSAVLPNRSMHPLLRALLLVAGAAVLTFVIIFGAVAFLALAAFGAIALAVQRWRMRNATPTASASQAHAQPSRVLEGEYVVVERRSNSR